jgi:ubiquinone/menaquinone biosynthesis C-methylase UbiE
MTDSSKERVARRFGETAAAYATNPGHARGADLDIVLRLLDPQPAARVCDVATGPGHTAAAVAPRVRDVVAMDLSLGMIQEARRRVAERGLSNVEFLLADAERMPFRDGAFDAVTCRVAPHHFPDVQAFARETARILVRGGVFVLEDSCSPDEPACDAFFHAVERRRDPTHVRSYTQAEWNAILGEAGFAIVAREIFRKEHGFDEWLSLAAVSRELHREVLDAFAGATEEVRRRFDVRFENGSPARFTDEKLIVRAERR